MPIDRLCPGTAGAAAFPAERRAAEYADLAGVAAGVGEPQLRAGMGRSFRAMTRMPLGRLNRPSTRDP
jgi:hypothetical protein